MTTTYAVSYRDNDEFLVSAESADEATIIAAAELAQVGIRAEPDELYVTEYPS